MTLRRLNGSRILLLPFCLLPLLALGKPIHEVEISAEPEENGRKLYTIKFLPGETRDYDELEFSCAYRQEFLWEDLRGRKTTKIHEPVVFVYRHHDARLVDDLHAYFNFRVPISMERLKKKYGDDVFNTEASVTVARIQISGIKEKKTLWSYEFEASGKHTIPDQPEREDTNDEELDPELE